MTYALPIAIILGLLLMWRIAWRRQPILALGITFGVMLVWILAAVIGAPEFTTVPLWLPPLPIAIVAVTLFTFGVLAWVWGTRQQGDDETSGHP